LKTSHPCPFSPPRAVCRLSAVLVCLGALLALFPLLSHGLPKNPGSEAGIAIQGVLSAQQAAWNRGDIPAFVEGYWHSPEVTFSGSNGTVRGFDGLLARYQKAYPTREAMGTLEFSDLEITLLGQQAQPDAALVLGHWHLKRATGDVGGVFTLVFRRFPIGWKIIHDHTSADEPKH